MPIAPNLLGRNFTPVGPNQVWTADMTTILTRRVLHPAKTLFNPLPLELADGIARCSRCASIHAAAFLSGGYMWGDLQFPAAFNEFGGVLELIRK